MKLGRWLSLPNFVIFNVMKELNKIYNEDCLIGMRDIHDKSIDCIICDPPYGSTNCAWDVIIPFDKLWEQYERIIKDNGAIILFGTEPFSSMLRMSNLKWYKYDLIWKKSKSGSAFCAKYRPIAKHENISIFSRNGGKTVYNPQMKPGKPYKRTLVSMRDSDILTVYWSSSRSGGDRIRFILHRNQLNLLSG